MAETTKKKPSRWMAFLIPALVLVLALWGTHMMTGSRQDPTDLTMKNFDVEGTAQTAFCTDIPKSQVESIRFRSTLEGAPQDAADVSENGSGKVLLWAEEGRNGGKDLIIAGAGAVYAPADASYLFGGKEYYRNLTEIDFGGVLHTGRTVNMHGMFYGCSAVKTLDLSAFDTHGVESMDWMFSGCGSLESVNLKGMNTEKVTDYGWMFQNCHALKSLDLTGFTVADNANTFLMFQNCESLEEVLGSDVLQAELAGSR